MKFLLLLVVLAASVASSLGLKNAICGLPHSYNGKDPHFCKALGGPSWSYNGKICVFFNYGGCNGNENRFGSRAECEKMCWE